MQQQVIGQRTGDHRFNDRHGADGDAGIMAALGDNFGLFARSIDGFFRHQDRRRWFDGQPGNEWLAGGNTTERSAGIVR